MFENLDKAEFFQSVFILFFALFALARTFTLGKRLDKLEEKKA